MNKRSKLRQAVYTLVVICCSGWISLAAADKLDNHLERLFADGDKNYSVKVWIYFSDKNESEAAYKAATGRFTDRAYRRRAGRDTDWFDLPVDSRYISGVEAEGVRVINRSRWLNAVSTEMTWSQIRRLAEKEYVRKITPVARLYRSPMGETAEPLYKPLHDSADYGLSYHQNRMLGADSLHKLGINGNGALLAFLDTGFLTSHQAFDSINIIDTWNFIDGNSNVAGGFNENQTEHGTATLSACGGFDAGLLIGPAYKADYILAKTEIVAQEIEIEEDNWVAGAEWADSLGADIISSSLGYSDWYTYADMDGNTAVTTVAADIAASRGILVITSAGNEGNSAWHYITAPADADSIIAVGAVYPDETLTYFSSVGPSYDGRIKPDLVAPGYDVRCARDEGSYFSKAGTSMSAPLISGLAAQVLQAIPGLRGNPMGLRRRLLESSDRYNDPDNYYGYGLPDGVLAAGYGLRLHPMPMVTVNAGTDTVLAFTSLAPPDQVVVFDPVYIPGESDLTDYGDGTAELWFYADPADEGVTEYRVAASAGGYQDTLSFNINVLPRAPSDIVTVGPNPCGDSLNIYVKTDIPGNYKIEIFSVSGELVYRAFSGEAVFTWPATNQAGEKVASGVYIIRFSADGMERKVKVFKM